MFGRQSHDAGHYKFWRSQVSKSSFAPFFFSKLDITGEKALLLPVYLELKESNVCG